MERTPTCLQAKSFKQLHNNKGSGEDMSITETTTDELLVESALGDGLYWGLWWRDVLESALSLDEDVALCAVAAEGVEVVGGVGGAYIADGSDEEEACVAFAALVDVDLISSADWVEGVELVALAVLLVVAHDAYTLAEDVVVDAVDGTGNGAGFGGGWGGVGAVGDKLLLCFVGTISSGHGGFCP